MNDYFLHTSVAQNENKLLFTPAGCINSLTMPLRRSGLASLGGNTASMRNTLVPLGALLLRQGGEVDRVVPSTCMYTDKKKKKNDKNNNKKKKNNTIDSSITPPPPTITSTTTTITITTFIPQHVPSQIWSKHMHVGSSITTPPPHLQRLIPRLWWLLCICHALPYGLRGLPKICCKRLNCSSGAITPCIPGARGGWLPGPCKGLDERHNSEGFSYDQHDPYVFVTCKVAGKGATLIANGGGGELGAGVLE